MPQIRFDITDELSNMLMDVKGHTLKKAYAAKLFEKAIKAEHKKQELKHGLSCSDKGLDSE